MVKGRQANYIYLPGYAYCILERGEGGRRGGIEDGGRGEGGGGMEDGGRGGM